MNLHKNNKLNIFSKQKLTKIIFISFMMIISAIACCALSTTVSAATTKSITKITTCTFAQITPKTYSSATIRPTVTIKNKTYTLVRNKDYTITYSSNINVGTAKVVIKGKGNYTGTKTLYFKIKPRTISSATISAITTQTYTAKAIKPNPKITYKNKTLVKNKDYTLSYKNNTNKGTATITIKGKGNFTGTITKTFKIAQASITKATFGAISTKAYNCGKAITPVPTALYNGKALVNGKDFTLKYTGNKQIGTAKITITGKGNYKGTKTITFKIGAKSLTSCSFSTITTKTYTGKQITPNVTVFIGSNVMLRGYDYDLTYKNNINTGTATIIVTGKNHLKGTYEIKFKINPKTITSANTTINSIPTKYYTGYAIKPNPTVIRSKTTLVKNTDYTVSYKNNIAKGTATVTIKGKNNYTGSVSKTFTIKQRAISQCNALCDKSITYTGSGIIPENSLSYGNYTLKKSTDYTAVYSNNTNAGTATITYTGKGNFKGTTTTTYEILPTNLADQRITLSATAEFTGEEITPLPTIYLLCGTKLVKDIDYTIVSYENNVNIGTATITLEGKGNLTGTVTKTFTITQADISVALFSSISPQTYNGKAITPIPNITVNNRTLIKDTDYSLSYSKNTNAGTATITVTGKNNYTGTATKTFTIKPKSVTAFTMSEIKAQSFSYAPITPQITISDGTTNLLQDTDFTLSYENNTNAGTATVKAVGKNNYTGTLSQTFTIEKANISSCTITKIPEQIYTGQALTPKLTIKLGNATLLQNTDFTATYYSNTNAGTATVVILGKGNFTNGQTIQFSIKQIIPITSLSFTTSTINTQKGETINLSAYVKQLPTINTGTILWKTDNKAVATVNSNGTVTALKTGTVKITVYCGEDETISALCTINVLGTESAVKQKIADFMSGKYDIYTNGKCTRSYKVGNYFNSLITSPCTCHAYCDWTGSYDACTCNVGKSIICGTASYPRYGIQCVGFAYEMFDKLWLGTNGAGDCYTADYTGSFTETAVKSWVTANFRAGDYLWYNHKTYGAHAMIIADVNADGITVYEANYGGRCKINSRTITYSELAKTTTELFWRTPKYYAL